ncbi:vascular endothelial growth factor receptor 1-like [Anneissia japonica]|uniref:vascular endothelial growth factor receptor 1-like n=1 Tax=Anneissia japonica TaxID=1529436 RepID=UPI0014258798|nr:vascular endothelial growth factor receptor 1-like [Anneissia japonica]
MVHYIKMKTYVMVLFMKLVIKEILLPHSACLAGEMGIIIGSKFFTLSDDNPCATRLPPNLRYNGEEIIHLCKKNERNKVMESVPLRNTNDEIIWGTTFLEVMVGQNALLKCFVQNLANGSKVMWYRKEKVRVLYITNKKSDVNDHTRILVNKENGTFNLQIVNVTQDDAGTYLCQIQPKFENAFNNIQPQLKVLVPSDIVRIEPNVTLNTNPQKRYFNLSENAFLNCITDGIPKPNITWTRSDKLLNKTIINGKLLLPNIQTEDSGIYICDAMNMVNGHIHTDRKHVQVIIKY